MRDLLECVWPAALDTAQQPFRSADLDRGAERDRRPRRRRPGPHPPPRRGPVRAGGAPRRSSSGRAETVPADRRKLFAALADPAGVIAHRPGALERVQLLLDRLAQPTHRLADTEARMVAVLDELELTELVTSIPGISAGRRRRDPGRDRRPAPLRHRPRPGQTRRPRAAGETLRHVHRPHQTHRPGPTRTAAGRLARGLGSPTRQPRLRRPLPAPDQPRDRTSSRATQAQTVIAAAILRHLHAVITTGQRLGPRHRHPRHPHRHRHRIAA